MPILDLQRRMRQLGEIRIGHVVPMANGKSRPEKLSKFRFTSPSKAILDAVAQEYGGATKPWTPASGGPEEFEVYTEVNRLPVIIPPLAVTQWYEMYAGSKCVRRCDGALEQKTDKACMCNPDARDCSIVTRLNVMLRDVSPIGYWLLISHGYYAAMELPPVADLLAQTGGHTPGWLAVEERRIVREKPGGGTETNRFMVPTLDIDIAPSQLLAGQSNGYATPELAREAPPAIEAAKGDPDKPDPDQHEAQQVADDALDAKDVERIRELWRSTSNDRVLDATVTLPDSLGGKRLVLRDMLKILADKFTAAQVMEPGRTGTLRKVDDVDLPSDEPADTTAIWMQVMAASPWGTTDELLGDFSELHGGIVPADATAEQLTAYVANLKSRGSSALPGVPY